MYLRTRINFIDFLNRYIKLANDLLEIQKNIKEEKYSEIEELSDDISDIQICYIDDIGAKIICGYIESIAQRAIELNDEKLIKNLECLFIIKKNENEEISGKE